MNIWEYVNTKEFKEIRVLSFLREFAKVSAKEVADALGISASYLSLLESGKREADKETVESIANALSEKIKLSNNLMRVVDNCVEDNHLMELLSIYATKQKVEFKTLRDIVMGISRNALPR